MIILLSVNLRSVRLYVAFILETDYLVLEWIKLMIILLFLRDRLQADKFMIKARASTAKYCYEEEKCDANSYEEKMLESEKDEDDANIVHVLARFDECQRTDLLILNQSLLLEFITHLEKFNSRPNEQRYHQNIFDYCDHGHAPITAVILQTSSFFVVSSKFADEPVDGFPAAEPAIFLSCVKSCVYKQI